MTIATEEHRLDSEPKSGSELAAADTPFVEASAKRLEAIAEDPRYSPRRDDLRSLARALREDEHEMSSPWASVSLLGAFPPASTVTVRHSSPLEGVLGALAGVTVFLPVAWTWFSLRSATEAYNGMIGDGSAAGASFLELWSTGFDGRLAAAHHLAPMALVSFVLIVLSVGLIVAHRLEVNRVSRRETMEAVAAEAELASTLTMAQRALATRNVEDPAQVASLVRSSLSRLTAAHKATMESAEALRSAVAETGQTLRDASVESAQHLVSGSRESRESLVAASAVARRDLEASARSAADAVAHTRQTLDAMVASAGQAMRESTSALVEGLDTFGRAQASLDASAARLVAAVESMGAEGKTAMQDFQNDFRSVSQALDIIRINFLDRIDLLVESVREVQVHMIQLQRSSQGQVDELTRTREATQSAALEFATATNQISDFVSGRIR